MPPPIFSELILISEKSVFIFYVFCIVGGFSFAYLYGRRTSKFVFKEYFAMLILPLLGVAGTVWFFGLKILTIFITSCLLGPLLEWLLGFSYHKILGSRLWVYKRYPIPGRYSSWLTIPFWGLAFVFIYLFFNVLF